jgi:3',5'-cyclic AMP phosphodiesterase CpdA
VLVAHFSDLHLLALEGARIRHFLGKRATGGVNLLFNRGGQFPASVARALVADIRDRTVDHVVVSGDLTNLAFPAEFRLVRSILEQLPLPPSEVTVVPGNHDYYTRDAAACDHFGEAMVGFSAEAGRFPLLRVRGELAVVALNSAHPTPPLMAYGTLGSRQLREARALLAAVEQRERFRLVVLHHPPHREHVSWHNRLTDLRAFVSMIRDVGAELVVHGHLHRPVRVALDGPDGSVPVIGVASGTWLSPDDPARRAQYNLYRTEGRRLAEVTTRRYDPGSGVFRTAPP